MITIEEGVLCSKLTGQIKTGLLARLKEALSFTDEDHVRRRTIAYRKLGYVPKELKWNGVTYLLKEDMSFPSGCLFDVIEILNEWNQEFTIKRAYKIPKAEPHPLAKELNLRDYQSNAVEQIKDYERGIVRIGTGGGKTKLSLVACSEIGQFPFLFIVHRISLLEQTHKEYSEFFDEEIGWLGDGTVNVQKINIASIATICSILKIKYDDDSDEKLTYTKEQIEQVKKLLRDCKFVIVDECHHAGSSTYNSIINKLENTFYRIGLSATPRRTDGKGILLTSSFGPVIFSKSASSLIKEGHLCKPTIRVVEYNDPKSRQYPKKWPRGQKKPNYNTVYKNCVVENGIFNTIVATIAVAHALDNDLTLVSVKQIKHGEPILKAIQKIAPEIPVVFLHSNNKNKLGVEKVKEDFGNHKIKILISTLFDEGVDIPKIDTVLDAGGGRSPIKTLQLVGRALRKYEGKTKATIYMFARKYVYLYNHFKETMELLTTEPEFDVEYFNWDE